MRRGTAAALCALGMAAGRSRQDRPGPTARGRRARGRGVGDSAISGEAGRWAGNTNGSSARVDALGPTAYYDNAANTAETIPGCHRSKAAEIHIGGGVNSKNLACSGARTYTQTDAAAATSSPVSTSTTTRRGHIGQALALQQFAATHNVKMVIVLIGAQQLRLRRASCRRASTELADLAVVVEELLQRRLERDEHIHRADVATADGEHQERASSTSARRWRTPATPTRRTR